jgi:hypothetical protein
MNFVVVSFNNKVNAEAFVSALQNKADELSETLDLDQLEEADVVAQFSSDDEFSSIPVAPTVNTKLT